MSEELIIDFDNPSNFIYDPFVVDVQSDAELKVSPEPGLTFNQDFSSDVGFTYDSLKAQFNIEQIEQIDQRPANSILGATYTDSFDLSFTADTFIDKTATLNGTPTLVGGKLVCNGTQGVLYKDDLIGALSGDWVSKFKYAPNYDTAPATNVNLFAVSQASGGVDDIIIFNSPSGGNIRITANGLSAEVFGTWSPTLGQEYTFEVFCISNVVTIWIDGVQLGTGKTITPGQGTESNFVHLGAYSTTYNTANGSFDDFIVYSTASQSTSYSVPEAAYIQSNALLPQFVYAGSGNLDSFDSFTTEEENTPLYILNDLYFNGTLWISSDGTPSQANTTIEVNNNIALLPPSDTIIVQIVFTNSDVKQSISNLILGYSGQTYPINNPSIEYDADVYADALESINEVSVKPGQDQVKAIIKVDNSWRWYNTVSGEWEDSNETYEQVNTIAEINSMAVGAFSQRHRLRIRFFLHSDDGTTTPTLSQITIVYSFAPSTEDSLDICSVHWYSRNPDGSVCDCLFRAQLSQKTVKYKNQTLVCNKDVIDTPDVNDGYTELQLVPTVDMSKEDVDSITYEIQKGMLSGGVTTWDTKTPVATISVPNTASEVLWDLRI